MFAVSGVARGGHIPERFFKQCSRVLSNLNGGGEGRGGGGDTPPARQHLCSIHLGNAVWGARPSQQVRPQRFDHAARATQQSEAITTDCDVAWASTLLSLSHVKAVAGSQCTVCVCVYACARVRTRARVCMCACMCARACVYVEEYQYTCTATKYISFRHTASVGALCVEDTAFFCVVAPCRTIVLLACQPECLVFAQALLLF